MIKSKRDFIADFPGEKVAFFDDNPRDVREVQTVIPSYLFDPQGHHISETDIPNRVRSWKEISDLLL